MTILKIAFWTCLFVVFYTYIGYGMLLYLLIQLKRLFKGRKEEPAVNDDELPMMTLMICAYNEEDIIREKMENIRQLDYPREKLCVMWVTDGSNDHSNDMLREYPEVTLVYSPERRGKAAAIHHGLSENKAPFVIFTDANTMLNVNAIREIARQFQKDDVGCVSGEKRVAARGAGEAADKKEKQSSPPTASPPYTTCAQSVPVTRWWSTNRSDVASMLLRWSLNTHWKRVTNWRHAPRLWPT